MNAIRKKLALFAVCVGLVVLPAGAAYAFEYFNYVSSASFWPARQEGTPGENWREMNRVWRPIGYNFELAYIECPYSDVFQGLCYVNGVWTNSGSNPFTVTANGYGHSSCKNISGAAVYPVTCQTTRP